MISEFPPVSLRTPSGNGVDDGRALSIALGIYRLLPRGGLEDNCIRIAEELTRRGHDVTIFAAGAHPDLTVKVASLAPKVKPFFNHSRVAHFARSFVEQTAGKFDRIVAFQPVPGADILFIADWIRNRHHMPLWRRLTPRFRTYAGLEEQCFSPTSKTRIIGLSDPQVRAYVERYGTQPDRIAVVPPTMAPAMRQPQHRTDKVRNRLRAEFGLDPKTPMWLWLGLQPSVKGLDRVLEALEQHPGTYLLVGGFSGSERKVRAYRARAMRKGVDDRIRWLGYVSGPRLMDCVAAADALAHPARVDVTGGVILEAIVNGLPVVSSSVCGFAEHVSTSGAGKVVEEPFDLASFSAALAEVCGVENAIYSARGIAYGLAPSLYSGTAVACDLIEAEHWSREEREHPADADAQGAFSPAAEQPRRTPAQNRSR